MSVERNCSTCLYKFMKVNCTDCFESDGFPNWHWDSVDDECNACKSKSQILCEQCNKNETEQQFDTVKKPAHYNQGEIECIDAIKVAVSNLQGIDAVCTANAIKYLWRWKLKGGVEDLKKAKWYIDKLITQQGGER